MKTENVIAKRRYDELRAIIPACRHRILQTAQLVNSAGNFDKSGTESLLHQTKLLLEYVDEYNGLRGELNLE